MNYQKYFKKWKSWETFEEDEKRFDGLNGVYAFRLKSSFGRLIGTSDVIYIGKCDQNPERPRSGLWHRLRNYKQKNDGASERLLDVEKKFGGQLNIEYAYVVCDDPRKIEGELLSNYYMQHMELPPLNRNK